MDRFDIGSADDFLFKIVQQIVILIRANDILAGNLQDKRHRHRRYHIKTPAHNIPVQLMQRIGKPASINQPLHGIAAHRLQQNMIGLMAAQHVLDQI